MLVCGLLVYKIFVKSRIYPNIRDIIERATHSALRSSFWIWVKKMDEDWDHVESRKEDIGTRKNGDNPNNQPNAVCTKFSSNSL